MAEVKKPTAKVIAKAAPVKEEAKKAEVKPAEIKVEAKAEPKAEAKAPAKAPAKKAAAKKAPAKKPAAKKEPVKKEAAAKKAPAKKAATAKKTDVKQLVHFQFSGKSYTQDDLVNICKDVWKYDLGGKDEDLKSIELYVKPEENTTYYVINGDVTGSFFI